MFAKAKEIIQEVSVKVNGKITKAYVVGLGVLSSSAAMAVQAGAEGEAASSVTSGVSTVVSLFGSVWDLISANAYLLTYVAIGLVGAVFGLVRKAKKSVR